MALNRMHMPTPVRQSSIATVSPSAAALVVTNAAHEILFATGEARNWLRRFFPAGVSGDVLPARIRRWLEARTSKRDDGVRARRAGASLFVRKYAPQPGDCTALLLELLENGERLSSPPGALSRRQQDVLRWVASGKSNKAIAAILEISPKTVGKHVEHVFRKLGVTSRVAAANAYSGYARGSR